MLRRVSTVERSRFALNAASTYICGFGVGAVAGSRKRLRGGEGGLKLITAPEVSFEVDSSSRTGI